jgi:hypothetical protein
MDGTMLLAGSAVAVAVVLELIRTVQRRRTIRVRRSGDDGFVISFEAATSDEVAQVVHALLERLSTTDGGNVERVSIDEPRVTRMAQRVGAQAR